MKRYIFLADLHGNMPATLAMEEEIKRLQPDEIWFLGDAVGKGPESDKTCDWVRSHCHHFVGGNWDYGLSRSRIEKLFPTDVFYWDQIGEERFNWLDSLPKEDSVLISGIHFRLIHGRPVDQLYAGYDSDEKLSAGLVSRDGSRTYGGLICADSHRPFVRSMGAGYVMNTGSVGNSIGVTRAHALMLEGEPGSETPAPLQVTVLSVPYDNQKAAAIAEQYPQLPNLKAYQNEVLTGVYSR